MAWFIFMEYEHYIVQVKFRPRFCGYSMWSVVVMSMSHRHILVKFRGSLGFGAQFLPLDLGISKLKNGQFIFWCFSLWWFMGKTYSHALQCSTKKNKIFCNQMEENISSGCEANGASKYPWITVGQLEDNKLLNSQQILFNLKQPRVVCSITCCLAPNGREKW